MLHRFRKPPVERKPERVTKEAAAAILGVPERTVIHLASRGEIPSAAKIGRLWTFNEEALREWVKAKEDEIAGRMLVRARVDADRAVRLERWKAEGRRRPGFSAESDRRYELAMQRVLRGGK